MPTRRPTPRRPPLTAPRGKLRAAYRLTAGMSRTNLARAENVTPAEIDQLLAQPDFQELLEALAEMAALPPEERLRQLERDGLVRPGDGRRHRRLAGRRLRRRPDAPQLPPRPLLGPGRPRRPGPGPGPGPPASPSARAVPAPTTPSTPPSAAPRRACAPSSAGETSRICPNRRRPSPSSKPPPSPWGPRPSRPPNPAAPTR